MKGEKILVSEAFRGVLFENFPATKAADGYKYKVLDAIIAERAAEEVPVHLRNSVTIDFSTLDEKYEREVRKDIHSQITMTPDQLVKAEQQIINRLLN